MSQIARGYAPEDRSLVSVSVIDNHESDLDELEHGARSQLRDWFGPAVNEWRALQHCHVARALPRISPTAPASATEIEGLVVCGDHLESASIQGAMLSGRRAAEVIIDRGDFPN